jgi:multicomponent Na+:H+ antiporter subunit C
MIGLAAAVVTVLFATSIYLMLSRNTQRIAIGFIILSNGVNLLVLSSAGLPDKAVPPLVAEGAEGLVYADPLPQAFILTAIVIGLGTAAFLLAMAAKAHLEMGTDDLGDRLQRTGNRGTARVQGEEQR